MIRRLILLIVLLLIVSPIVSAQTVINAEDCGFPDLYGLADYIIPSDLRANPSTSFGTGGFYDPSGECIHGTTTFSYTVWAEVDGERQIAAEDTFEVYGIKSDDKWTLAWRSRPFYQPNMRFMGAIADGTSASYYYVDLFTAAFFRYDYSLLREGSRLAVATHSAFIQESDVPEMFIKDRKDPFCGLAADYEIAQMHASLIEPTEIVVNSMVDMSPEGSRCEHGYLQVFDISDLRGRIYRSDERAEYAMRMYFVVDGELTEPYSELTNAFFYPAWVEHADDGVTSFVLRRLDSQADRYIRFTIGDTITTEEVFPFVNLPSADELLEQFTFLGEREVAIDQWHCQSFADVCPTAAISFHFYADNVETVSYTFTAHNDGSGFTADTLEGPTEI